VQAKTTLGPEPSTRVTDESLHGRTPGVAIVGRVDPPSVVDAMGRRRTCSRSSPLIGQSHECISALGFELDLR